MKIGIIHETASYSLEGECRERFELHNFSISTELLSGSRIFYSAFATPARYVMELFRRLRALDRSGRNTGCFLFNPFLTVGPETAQCVIGCLPDIELGLVPVVVTDRKNFPIGYYLPPWIGSDEAHFLTLLSTVNGALDQQLLNALFFSRGFVCTLDELPPPVFGNGFMVNDDLFIIYNWTAANALTLLKRLFPPNCTWGPLRCIDTGGNQLRTLRDAVPFVAVMPHHAGDVLFYALAARDTDSHINRIVVNQRYVNILEDVLPGYGKVTINPAPPNREGNVETDEQCFMGFAPDLPPFAFYYYCRQVLNYNVSEFNLIDHFGFALGQSFCNRKELISQFKKNPLPYKPQLAVRPFRVLLHFDAGWGLKVYPEHYRKELIKGLLARGVELTVLGNEDRDSGSYRSVKFTGLTEFRELLNSHHLLVGSDSFPSHYAAHVAGLPTICLFGPTKPANSDARLSGHYKYLEGGLACRPCSHMEYCHTHGKPWCSNFVPPEDLLSELFAMLDVNYDGGNINRKVKS